jgi:hypothetical protein
LGAWAENAGRKLIVAANATRQGGKVAQKIAEGWDAAIAKKTTTRAMLELCTFCQTGFERRFVGRTFSLYCAVRLKFADEV